MIAEYVVTAAGKKNWSMEYARCVMKDYMKEKNRRDENEFKSKFSNHE